MLTLVCIYVLQVTSPIDESTFLSADLHLLESIELKKRTKHIVEIIEEVTWDDVDPDMLTRFHFIFSLSVLSCRLWLLLGLFVHLSPSFHKHWFYFSLGMKEGEHF